MKKGIAILAVAATSLSASAAPTVYGKINKFIGYTDQDAVHSRTTMTGVEDVRNSESRLGVKGTAEILHMETKYNVEIGLNSTHGGDSVASNVRMRQANMVMKSAFGSITLGQAFTPLSSMAIASDVLNDTVASFKGSDQSVHIANATSAIGFEYASRKDQVGYMTPNFHGLTYSAATYRAGDDLSNEKNGAFVSSVTATEAAARKTNIEHLVRYQRDMGSMNMDFYFGMRKTNDGTKKTDENMMYGANFGFGAFGLSFGMSADEDQAITAGAEKVEINRMFAGASYNMDANTRFAFTYQTRENKKSVTTTYGGDHTQMAFNVRRLCNEFASVNLTVMKYEFTTNDTSKTGDAKKFAEADATQVALGLTLKF